MKIDGVIDDWVCAKHKTRDYECSDCEFSDILHSRIADLERALSVSAAENAAMREALVVAANPVPYSTIKNNSEQLWHSVPHVRPCVGCTIEDAIKTPSPRAAQLLSIEQSALILKRTHEEVLRALLRGDSKAALQQQQDTLKALFAVLDGGEKGGLGLAVGGGEFLLKVFDVAAKKQLAECEIGASIKHSALEQINRLIGPRDALGELGRRFAAVLDKTLSYPAGRTLAEPVERMETAVRNAVEVLNWARDKGDMISPDSIVADELREAIAHLDAVKAGR